MSHTHIPGAKYLWCAQRQISHDVHDLAQQFNLSIPIVQVLINRGMTSTDSITQFLSDLDEDIADPLLLKDALRAVTRIEQAIANNEKILIAGDYDVDGVTSSALILVSLKPLGAHINFFLPHRQRDGYGLSVNTIRRAAANGYKVIITVDNGITAFEPAREAKNLGIDLIITDHHQPHAHLPDAYAIVDPHQSDCKYPFKYFAGVGVSFKLMSLLYTRRSLPLPSKVYELLLLGTVADVVPLIGENRFWVRRSLRHINQSKSLSLAILKKNAQITKEVMSSLDIGFYVAPQINALGRLDDAREAVAFLIGSQPEEVERIGIILANMNQARKNIEKKIVAEIVANIESGIISIQDAVLVVEGKDWPSGVVGLVASRLVGLYGRPAIVLHCTTNGTLKGSCRSIAEIDIFNALDSVKNLLISFGGHPMAAGVALAYENLASFRTALHEYVIARIALADMKQRIYLDAELTLPDLNKKLVQDMKTLEPFGAGNREPIFLISSVTRIGDIQVLKEAHVKCMVFQQGVMKPIIFFNRPELYHTLQSHDQEPFNVAASVTENHWNGKINIELCGIDVTLSSIPQSQ